MALFRNDATVTTTFAAKDQMTPVVRGIRNTMSQFKADARTGFGLGAGIGVFNLATQAIGSVVDIAGDAVRAFAEEERSVAKMTAALEANVDAWDGNTDAIEEVLEARMRLGFADDEQRDSLARLVAVTKDVNQALALQRDAMDLARLRNMSLKDAADLLGKVYGGNVGILSRYGIQLKKGTTATEALAEIQKRAAGQAEAYADTLEGKMTFASMQVGEAMEKVGEVLAPLVAEFASFAADAIPEVISGLGNLGDAFNNVHRFMNPGLAALQDFEEAVRAQAVALGIDADAAWEFVRAQERQAAMDEEIVRWKSRLVSMGRTEAEAEAFIREEMARQGLQYEETTDAVEGQTDAMRRASAALDAYRFQYMETGGLMIQVQPKLRAVAGAVEDTGDAAEEAAGGFRGFRDSVASMVESFDEAIEPLVGITKRTLAAARKEARIGAAEYAWAMKHPLKEARLEEFYERQVRLWSRRARRAQRQENTLAYAEAQAQLARFRGLLADHRAATATIIASWQMTVGPVSSAPPTPSDLRSDPQTNPHEPGTRAWGRWWRRHGYRTGGGRVLGTRAMGGRVEEGETYVVGERGPEVLVAGRGGGNVIPNHRAGSGGHGHAIYLDRELVGRALDRWQGGQLALNGSF